MKEVGKEEVWVERQGRRDVSLEGGRLGGNPRRKEGECSDGRIKAVLFSYGFVYLCILSTCGSD